MSRPACSVFPSINQFDWDSPVDFQLIPLQSGLRCTKSRLLASMGKDWDNDNGSFLTVDTPSSPLKRRRGKTTNMKRGMSDRDARTQRLANRRRAATPGAAATKKRRRATNDLDGFVAKSDSEDNDEDDEDDEDDENDEDDEEDDDEDEDETSDEDEDSILPPRERLIRSCSARNKDLRTGGPSLERIEQDVLTPPVGSSPVGGSDPLTPSASADEGGVSGKALLERLRIMHDVVRQQNTTIQDQQDRLDAFDLLESGSGSKDDDDDDDDFCGRAGAGAGTGPGQKQSQSAVDADLLQKVPAGVLAARFRRQWDRVFSSGAKDIDALVTVGVSPDVAASIQRFARSLALKVRVVTCRTTLRVLGFSSDAIDGMVSAMATLGARAPSADCPNTVEGLLLTGPPGTGKTFLMDTISAYVKHDCGLLVPEVLVVDRGMMRAQYSGVAEQDIWAVFEAANTTPVPVTWRAVVDFLVEMGMSREDLEARALRAAKAAAPAPAPGQAGVVGVVDPLDRTVDLTASIGVILMDECQSILSKSSEAHDSGISTTANASMGRPCRPDTLVVVLAATNDIEQVHPASQSRLKNLAVTRPDADAALVVMNNILAKTIEGFDGFPSPKAQAAIMAAVAEAENDIRTMRMIAAEVAACRMATSQGVVVGRSFLEACLGQLQFSESGDVAVPAPVPPPVLKGAFISHLPTEADYISVATRVTKEVRGVAEYALSRLLGPEEDDDKEERPKMGMLIEEEEE